MITIVVSTRSLFHYFDVQLCKNGIAFLIFEWLYLNFAHDET